MKRIFVTGISTEVGKTVASAIITEALEADYWKPIQAGDLENSDSHKVAALISNTKTIIHPNSYSLKSAMSPHAAAAKDELSIDLNAILEPATSNHLVIEGAGGILVPLNNQYTILDIIRPEYKVVVVSKNYLGSINHSLLTLGLLLDKGLNVSILFNGHANPSTESIILEKTGLKSIGRVEQEQNINTEVIKSYAQKFKSALQAL